MADVYEVGVRILRMAETLIQSQGWCKDELVQKNGAYCLIGAIAEATNIYNRSEASVCFTAHSLSDSKSKAYAVARHTIPMQTTPWAADQRYRPGLVCWNDRHCKSERQARALLRLARLHLAREARNVANRLVVHSTPRV